MNLALYPIFDLPFVRGAGLHPARTLDRLIDAGVRVVQFRDKVASDADLIDELRPVAAACKARGVTVLINDRVEVARAVGADGVHLGRGDAETAFAREVLGRRAIVGRTVNTVAEAAAAAHAGADYLGAGPVFPTLHKDAPAPVIGIDGLAAVCAAVSIPVVAIGGIDAERARACTAAGAAGVAVIGALFDAPLLSYAVKRLTDAAVAGFVDRANRAG